MSELHVSFEERTIMAINGRVQHVDDTIPPVLASLVETVREDIFRQMAALHGSETLNRPFEHSITPTILIARMALMTSPNIYSTVVSDVLTQDAILSSTNIFTHHKSLTAEYAPYWTSLSHGTFLPEVQRLDSIGEYPPGVWLGVRARAPQFGKHAR